MMNAKEARALTDNAFPILMKRIEADIQKAALNGDNTVYIGLDCMAEGDLLDKVKNALESLGYKFKNNAVIW